MATTAGLYIHVPFCASKCPYCDFYSTRDHSLVPAWMEALGNEARLYRDFAVAFDTVYLGGGTPTVLEGEQLAQVMESLRDSLVFAPDAEVSIEANPDDINPSKLTRLRKLGFNRISLGVQSFRDGDLVFLRRRHSAAGAVRAVELIREAGFKNLNLDLIYGLPGQRLESWRTTLEKALVFAPEHLSCYQLTIESGTLFGAMKDKGVLQEFKESDQEAFFLTTAQYLADQGYLHYEIANFAKGKDSRCRHNLKYWQRQPYLGLGPAAHSFSGKERWWNVRSIRQYAQALHRGDLPVAGREWLNDEQIRMEKIFLGFRTSEGIGLEVVANLPPYRVNLAELQEHGLMTVVNGRAVPTQQGFLVADRLPQQFF